MVALPAAGYHYSGGWTPPLVGLTPTGTTASLAARPPRFPGSPSCAFAPVRDPGRTDGPSPMTVPPVLPLLHRKQRLRRDVYIEATAGLKHLLSTLQERRCHRHMQDSLPVGWLAFTGRELNPLDRDERFPSTTSLPPFLDLSWRYRAKTPERLQRVERPPANSRLCHSQFGGRCSIRSERSGVFTQ